VIPPDVLDQAEIVALATGQRREMN
jgi:hypothetical protein